MDFAFSHAAYRKGKIMAKYCPEVDEVVNYMVCVECDTKTCYFGPLNKNEKKNKNISQNPKENSENNKKL